MRIVLFRGLVGLIFSRGLDTLASKLKKLGHEVEVKAFPSWRKYKRDRDIDVIIGHSLGARSSIQLAQHTERTLLNHNLKLVVCIDYVEGGFYKTLLSPFTQTVHFRTDDRRAKDIYGAENIRVNMSHIQADDSETIHNLIIQRIDALGE